jgi:hypothetical protein
MIYFFVLRRSSFIFHRSLVQTVSRISNWPNMSQLEKDRTIRLLVRKRNVERITKLNDDEQSQGEGNGNEVENDASA